MAGILRDSRYKTGGRAVIRGGWQRDSMGPSLPKSKGKVGLGGAPFDFEGAVFDVSVLVILAFQFVPRRDTHETKFSSFVARILNSL
jgi:hypothetical protein